MCLIKFDLKGQINIEFIFCILISIILIASLIPVLNQNIDSNMNTENNLEGRILLNHVANEINQVNSNNYGFSKTIELPEKIENSSYLITVKTNEVILEYDNKKGKAIINPINLVNSKNKSLEETKLLYGESYKISKEQTTNNQTNTINQSSILIRSI